MGSGGARCTFFYASGDANRRTHSQAGVSNTHSLTARSIVTEAINTHQFPLHDRFGNGWIDYQDMVSNAFNPPVNVGFFIEYPDNTRVFVIVESNRYLDSEEVEQLIDDINRGHLHYQQRLQEAGYPIGNFTLDEQLARDVLRLTRSISLRYYDETHGDALAGSSFVDERANRVFFTTPSATESDIARNATHILQWNRVIAFNESSRVPDTVDQAVQLGVTYENLSDIQQANLTALVVSVREGQVVDY